MRVLLYDVETSPNLAWIWGKYEQDALGDFEKERKIISFAWKWLGESKISVLAIPMFKRYKKDPEDNRALIKCLHKLFSEADVVIGHNVDQFDDKMANTDFICNGLPPPPPHKTIDTLKIARSKFRFNSNKLDDLGARLGLGRKRATGGFKLWFGCLKGIASCWRKMMLYNKRDVGLLEKVYLKLRPWISNHPDLNALDGIDACPSCKSKDVRPRGWGLSNGGYKRQRFKCGSCSRWAVGRLIKASGAWKYS